ncbi:MAG: NTP transferase domain-containing protein [Woeseiaceae bacterium]|nr:NTP transferase domain-containing protein [Woeseiaceae bacterium]
MTLSPQVARSRKSVYAIVLAAGTASRFGATKQTAEFDGKPMVRRCLDAAGDACGEQTVLVVGHDWQSVVSACEPTRSRIERNDRYEEGLGTSIACGVQSVRYRADAVIIMLADQPLVTADHIRQLIDAWSGNTNEIVATSFSETQGPPTLFASGCFDELCALTGDTGGKRLFTDRRFTLESIAFEPAGVDIDKPEDVKRSEP